MRGFWVSAFIEEEDWEQSDFELILSLRDIISAPLGTARTKGGKRGTRRSTN